VKITVGNIRECYKTLVFGSRSDFPQSSPKFALTDCCSQSSQIRHRCHNFCFEVFFADSRMPTYHGISTAWCGVYLISVIDLFTRWVSSSWLYLWSMIHIGIALKPPWTLCINLWVLQLLWLIKMHLIMLPSLIGPTRPIVILISPSLYILDPLHFFASTWLRWA
jgi:hypothetical protein